MTLEIYLLFFNKFVLLQKSRLGSWLEWAKQMKPKCDIETKPKIYYIKPDSQPCVTLLGFSYLHMLYIWYRVADFRVSKQNPRSSFNNLQFHLFISGIVLGWQSPSKDILNLSFCGHLLLCRRYNYCDNNCHL